MDKIQADRGRRRLLIGVTSAIGGVGVGALATPFVLSMLPSARAKAAGAPVEADISKLEPGMMVTQEWRGQPVWIINRTPAMMAQLEKNAHLLSDPDSDRSEQPEPCKNVARAMPGHDNILVVLGICTHLGCSPTEKLKAGNEGGMGSDWPGGFLCPCHGSKYDLSARVFKNMPAPLNMRIPPYTYLDDQRLLIGANKKRG
ncbi:MAG: ubiquinol-cytochrome c reductase iron-sulfur subunit [Ferrovum sp.]|jgi:ubiquinol-cytochrome c reductase, iron-sulfur subunit|uniref:ubiquinol-cytochrome c reductase iron-sulfur subunit n=1 Tax=Ferrovum sp. TaxID=2609467 RepID=UPI002629D281|nr:ubiquinol-cytochrome c reductase iron-sulfur subunit [Ferrovum sp.]MBW8067642.1 ubiquinol-cytochrome c reductase iron-sulfur subunit [Ferrovum sp.]